MRLGFYLETNWLAMATAFESFHLFWKYKDAILKWVGCPRTDSKTTWTVDAWKAKRWWLQVIPIIDQDQHARGELWTFLKFEAISHGEHLSSVLWTSYAALAPAIHAISVRSHLLQAVHWENTSQKIMPHLQTTIRHYGTQYSLTEPYPSLSLNLKLKSTTTKVFSVIVLHQHPKLVI